ncbi:MAG TPA: LytR C-terminal domain-containing protein [Candidatus Saccharimonadales bacterium]|nr:LytR C-terminal domain-containing protein [Candidatus Saccharimonadales bacterium]
MRKRPFKYKSLVKTATVFLLFVFSFTSIVALFAYKNVTKSFTSALSNLELISGNSDISKQDLTSVMYLSVDSLTDRPVVVNNIVITFLDSDLKKIVSYTVAPNIVVDISGKFGQEELSKVVALGSLENDSDLSSGVALLEKTMTKIFGYKMDRYIVVDKSVDSDFTSFLTTGNSNQIKLQNLTSIKDSMYTDLNVKEMFDVYRFVSSLPDDRFTTTKLTQETIQNTDDIDSDIQNLTFDSAIAGEKKTISILNGSDKAGIANLSSRIIANIGGRVIATENANHIYKNGILVVDDPDSATVKNIQKIFGFTQVVKKGAGDIDESTLDRADITLIVGIDIANSL